MSHTPGPWEWRSDYRLYGGDVPIAELYRDSPDARLIAAAPDLLAALEEIANLPDEGEGGSDIARATITRLALDE